MTNTARSYFERLYASDPDPWQFQTSWYEKRKYALTVASLPKQRYVSAFEPGCSIGVLTEMLAPLCDELLSTDVIPSTLQNARNRLRTHPHVQIGLAAIPDDWPDRTFDLVVLSEIAYYFDESTWVELSKRLLESTCEGAHVVGVHWRGETDYPLSGDQAHCIIDRCPELTRMIKHREPNFALDIWERRG